MRLFWKAKGFTPHQLLARLLIRVIGKIIKPTFKFSTVSVTGAGFTLPEIIIVLGIISLFFGYILSNLLRTQQNSSLSTQILTLSADISEQHLKSMIGSKENDISPSAFGIYFTTTSYTLFKGDSYDPLNPNNIVIPLMNGVILSNITLAQQLLIFEPLSGDVRSFAANNNTITIKHAEGSEQKTLYFNRYGIIDTIN